MRIYDDIKECFELTVKAEESERPTISCYWRLLLDEAIDRITDDIRHLSKEIREGRCGPVIVYLEPNERWR